MRNHTRSRWGLSTGGFPIRKRSLSEAVRQLTRGEGEILHGKGFLAIVKALL